MIAQVVMLLSDNDIPPSADPYEARRVARAAVEKLGTPDEGEITESLFGDGFRIVFNVVVAA